MQASELGSQPGLELRLEMRIFLAALGVHVVRAALLAYHSHCLVFVTMGKLLPFHRFSVEP